MFGGRQSASPVQTEKQAVVPLQTYGLHAWVVAVWQTPSPLQLRPLTSVAWPGGHDGWAQEVPAA
jgi:hypothetical protein